MKTLKMKITKGEPILAGCDVKVKIGPECGNHDATNHFLPYSVEGLLRDLIRT